MTEVTTGNGVVNTVTTCEVGADSAFHDDGVTQYQGAEVDCYCPTASRTMDTTGAMPSPIATRQMGKSARQRLIRLVMQKIVQPISIGVVLSISHSFTFDDPHTVSNQEVVVESPLFDELDNDGDGYIECTGFDIALFQSSGSDQASIIGGSDCDDYDDVTHLPASEIGDGQYNDCDNSEYSDDGAPADEADVDGDGFVECAHPVTMLPGATVTPNPMLVVPIIEMPMVAIVTDLRRDDGSPICYL